MEKKEIYQQVPNVKIVLLGESTVGKTSIINVIHNGNYIADQPTTIGACFYIRKMKVGDAELKLHIWDTAGQERFKSLAPMYYRDAHYVILVYAANSEDSFSRIDAWYKGLVQNCPELPRIVLVANKMDLVNEISVPSEKGKELAEQLKAKFYEVSAKEDKEGIEKIFDDIGIEFIETSNNDPVENTNNVILESVKSKKKCC